jgi:hypothetical protein
MKKVMLASLILALSAVSLSACNTGNPSVKQNETASVPAKEHATEDHEELNRSILMLNNGAKWQSDESTRMHAGNLNAFADKFSKQNNAEIEAFHAFADDMQNELNQLVKGCQMKGAEHDALHLWLEPVITGVKELKKVGTTAGGKRVAQKLIEDVKKFNQYFS